MSRFRARLNQLKKRYEEREAGIIHGIPLWEQFDLLAETVPTIRKGQVILNAASSGVGKSMITRYKDIITTWKYVHQHPETEIDLKFVVVLLEDSEERFIDYIICSMIGLKHKVHLSPTDIKSDGKYKIKPEVLELIESVEDLVEDLLSKCVIVDSIYNTYGIYKFCRGLSEDWGEHYYTFMDDSIPNEERVYLNKVEHSKLKEMKKGMVSKDKKELIDLGYDLKEYANFYKYSHYNPHNPKQHVILVVDNINCFQPDKWENNSLMEAMEIFAYKYARQQIAKHWNWTVVMVQQNVGSAEEQKYDFKGGAVIDKLVPSLDKLGDSKKTQRACHLIYGLFDPWRYGVNEFMKYKTNKLKDNARFLFVLKNNDGASNKVVPLWFHGASGVFRELPTPDKVNDVYIKTMRNDDGISDLFVDNE